MGVMSGNVRGPVTWAELDEQRKAFRSPKVSRAELCRRAGISESTVTKGLKFGHLPSRETREQVELILNAERVMREEGLR